MAALSLIMDTLGGEATSCPTDKNELMTTEVKISSATLPHCYSGHQLKASLTGLRLG